MTLEYRIGDVFERLAEIPDGSIDLIVTSPPFLALRSYLPADHPDKAREIGSEATPADFLDTLLALSAEWGRVLAPHGSICVELGDTFAGSGGAGGDYNPGGLREGQDKFEGSAYTARQDTKYAKVQRGDMAGGGITNLHGKKQGGGNGWPLAKSLTGIPTLYPWSLAYGRNLLTGQPSPAGQWRIRNVIVWARPNPPVGALGDKFRPATSYITVACRGSKRYFDLDAVRGEVSEWTKHYAENPYPGSDKARAESQVSGPRSGGLAVAGDLAGKNIAAQGAPPLDWHTDHHPEDGDWLWKMATQPYRNQHYATFPLTLPKRLIEAMCPLRVCVVCGRPSERIVDKPTELSDRHRAFSTMLRDRRNAVGLTQREVDQAFGLNGMCSHWECQNDTDKAQPAYPTAAQWPQLRALLNIDTDEYDYLIEGYRRWTLDPAIYIDGSGEITEKTRWSSGILAGKGAHSLKTSSSTRQGVTLGWSDCGHDNWRTGIVLDPFAGSGTTLEAAQAVGRHAIGIDLDPRNAELSRDRVGMFLETVDNDTPASWQQLTIDGAA